jgi:hypothetical protein
MNTLSNTLGGLVVVAALLQTPGSSSDGIWQPIAGSSDALKSFSESLGSAAPQISAFKLDDERLNQRLLKASRQLTSDSPVISIPMPDRTYMEFRVQETEVMPKELATSLKFKTYRGESVPNPRTTARFENGPEGFRAVVFTANVRVFVEPFGGLERAYASYAAARRPAQTTAQTAEANPPRCQVTAAGVKPFIAGAAGARSGGAGQKPAPADLPGTTLRTYRLAVAATGEYTAFHHGTVDSALRAIGATIHRVNEVYENELGITFTLVPGERKIVFTDAAKDPFTNADADKLMLENQNLLDAKIGKGNYDIGHVFSTGAGGKAFAGVCDVQYKGRGTTGRGSPIGEPFDIDYVAHEIGHQLGGNHTFNSTLGACGGGTRFANTAFEPGSGSTVLGYAGICDAADLEQNSHPYFHAATLQEIRDYVVGGPGSTCAATAGTGNTPPTVSVTSPITIPKSTPFRLAGQGVDKEQTTLYYAWEQLDLGAEAPPDNDSDGKARPTFRSYPPVTIATRTFPALDVLLSGATRVGEFLPAHPRALTFRLTARDEVSPAGGFGFADVNVTVSNDGPFAVTSPTANASTAAGASLAIAWTVNGTDQSPISCGKVAILLSVDDGKSTAAELAKSTPNDGAETVFLPAGATSAKARVTVECLNQPFFAVSGSFAIK